MESWIAEVIGAMHINNIKQDEVAHAMGIRRDYLNKILNGKNKTANAETRIKSAIAEIIRERNQILKER